MLIFSKIVFAPSPTNFLPQSFGKTSVFDKAQSNEKDKDKDKDKNKDIGTNNMDLVWQAKHGYITGHSIISAVQTTWIWFGRQNMGT